MADTPVMIRSSERTTFRRCPQKWYWHYVLRLENPRPKNALSFGSIIHEALEHYYVPGKKRGVHPVDTFAELYAASRDFDQWDEDGERIPADELGHAMLSGYIEEYGNDPDLEIIAPEMAFELDVLDEKGNYLFTYVGKFDAVYRRISTGVLGVFEHKTGKNVEEVLLMSGYGETGRVYVWAVNQVLREMGLLKPDEYVDHVLFNFLRKGVPSGKPRNAQGLYLNQPKKDDLKQACADAGLSQTGTMDQLKANLMKDGWSEQKIAELGEVSKVQPSPLFKRQEFIVGPGATATLEERMRAEAWVMGRIKAGLSPIYKNPTKDCRWECEFVDPCELHDIGADWKGVIKAEYTTWDPYSDHEIQEENAR